MSSSFSPPPPPVPPPPPSSSEGLYINLGHRAVGPRSWSQGCTKEFNITLYELFSRTLTYFSEGIGYMFFSRLPRGDFRYTKVLSEGIRFFFRASGEAILGTLILFLK